MKLLRDPTFRGRLGVALLSLVVLSLLAPWVWNTDARHLSAYRDGEEDMSILRASLQGVEVQNILATPHHLEAVAEPGKVLLLAIGPERPYTASEAEAMVAFLEAGGSIILADEGGYGTRVAQAADFGFNPARILDTRNHQGDPKLVVSTATLDGKSYNLLFNAPALLTNLSAGDYEVLVWSSNAGTFPDGSYLDKGGNGVIDQGDPVGPFPLVVRTHVGAGTLILVADTGLFMDRQTRLLDYQNADYLAALAESLVPSDGLILIDESRHAPPPGVAAYDATVRTLGRLTTGNVAPWILLTLVAAASVAAWWYTRPTEDWSHHPFDIGAEVPAPEDLRPNLERAQRLARRRISERYNIPLEQVAAMTTEQLLQLTGNRLLAEAASGALRSDPAPLFRSFSNPEAMP